MAFKQDRQIIIEKKKPTVKSRMYNLFTMKINHCYIHAKHMWSKQNRWGISHCWFLSSKDGYFQFINSQLSSLIYLHSKFLLGLRGRELGWCSTSPRSLHASLPSSYGVCNRGSRSSFNPFFILPSDRAWHFMHLGCAPARRDAQEGEACS